MQHHNMSFFGQKTGMLLDSAKVSDPFFFIRLIRKKTDGSWEKPSQNEGKAVKFNLLELCAISRVLHQPAGKWTTVHKHKDDTTSIVIDKSEAQCTWKVGDYLKNFHEHEIDLLLRLLDHILGEKIEQATDQSKNGNGSKESAPETEEIVVEPEANAEVPNNPYESEPVQPLKAQKPALPLEPTITVNPTEWITNLKVDGDFVQVPGIIATNRPQAFNVQINGLRSIWVPKSTCKSGELEEHAEGLWIKKWFIEKKLPDIFGTAESGQ